MEHYRVRSQINLDAIYGNILKISEYVGKDVKIMPIVKADAYGHGAVEVAKKLKDIAYGFGVAIVEEGVKLRNAGIDNPILILGYSPSECVSSIVEYGITQTIFDYESAKLLDEEAKRQSKVADIHIKIDTGMNRIGFSDTAESINEIRKIFELSNLNVKGIFTHFAKADETNKASVETQFTRFTSFIELLEMKGMYFPIKHAANSAAIIDCPHMKLDMVRCGIATYGLYPSNEVDKSKIKLESAMSITSQVSYVKKVRKGQAISYNGTYITKRDSIIATVPIGYADGYPRILSSKGKMIINGCYAPIVGRVCMDQLMVDVTDIDDVKRGDIVTILGSDNDKTITAEDIATDAGTINYEIICGFNLRMPRLYIKVKDNPLPLGDGWNLSAVQGSSPVPREARSAAFIASNERSGCELDYE